ncbi:dTDP-4-dehydrorhamnose reductase family protein [Paenibacillus methanolicus]|uniref:dTDP-4-dehydrorhamnose reductase n=1 Tax=Paenibacillus methanolicus TaxID=582686 RepID=A0A5S5BRM9_9BACL|nr:SDR family oxidoreductase [Paenibacillus methanolicus]TYP69855.1 dTDP-4-dehydrorhamnose reductase [Paenibacillus methanolicus]
MKLLIVGGTGMAGHMFRAYFGSKPGYEVQYTTRDADDPAGLRLEVTDSEAVASLVSSVRPDVILNAVGVLNQDAENRPLLAYQVNGLLPHWLRHQAEQIGARLIHISSDCVFSGERGRYTEADEPEGTTVYARSKALGEVKDQRHLTIRTSIIGPEIRQNGIGLLQWFLKQEGTVSGYARVMWNGVTTLELAKAVEYAIARPRIGGLVQLTAAETVSKLELLRIFREVFGRDDVTIVPDSRIFLDRSLVSTRDDWQYEAPGYAVMLRELAEWMAAR